MTVVRNHTLEVAPAAVTPAEEGATPKASKRQYYGKTARRGAVWSVIRQGGHEFVAVPTSMIMARLLSPSDFGIAATATFFIVLATRLTQFGFNAALVRIKTLRPDHLSTVFVVNAVLGVSTYLVLVSMSPVIGVFLRNAEAGRLLVLAAIIFLITPFGTVPAALMTRNMQFRLITITEWTDTIVGAVLSVLLAAKGYGYWSLIIGQLTGSGSSCASVSPIGARRCDVPGKHCATCCRLALASRPSACSSMRRSTSTISWSGASLE
jgi:O-antigen/teichoic acid export membrane protein